jgi:cytochrome b subunit of formate dehydrogenase
MPQIRRFTPIQRGFHLTLMLTFAVQSATGLARMYVGTGWGKTLAGLFGGFTASLTIHKWVGVFMLFAFGLHLIYILATINWRKLPGSIYGSDSLLPRLEDIGQSIQHVGWILGLKGPPKFDRWAYWEKFDYWAVFWGICLLGGTGLLLYSPVYSSRFIPGWTLNVLLWIHRIEATLAMAHVFLIHFFIGHLRRENFPMDLVMFEGSIGLEKARHERPDWIERMEKEGVLQHALVAESPVSMRIIYHVFGFAIISGCLYLLVNAFLNVHRLMG